MNIHTVSGIRTSNPTHRAAAVLRLTPHGHRDLPQNRTVKTVYFIEHFKTISFEVFSFGPSLFLCFSTLINAWYKIPSMTNQ
jgi:hypothetical protein